MSEVNITELRQNLPEYLAEVRKAMLSGPPSSMAFLILPATSPRASSQVAGTSSPSFRIRGEVSRSRL